MTWIQGFSCRSTLSISGIAVSSLLFGAHAAVALPPPDDIPEEVLRNQGVLDGRSAIDNSELSPTEYAELQALLEDSQDVTPRVSPELQRLILLLKLRKILRSVTPFGF
ncbi:MAG: hypothetical protein AAF974_02945 [Cyanobacteria bacterium P01_E01_bin.34]